MNHLIRGNSDTEITFERNLVRNEKLNRLPMGISDPKRALRSVNTDPNINETSISEFGLPLSRLHEIPRESSYLTSVLPYKKYSVMRDDITRRSKHKYCQNCQTDVFSRADSLKLRNVCSASSSSTSDLVGSWQERYKSASACSVHTASTETLVGYEECPGSDEAEKGKGKNVIVHRTGNVSRNVTNSVDSSELVNKSDSVSRSNADQNDELNKQTGLFKDFYRERESKCSDIACDFKEEVSQCGTRYDQGRYQHEMEQPDSSQSDAAGDARGVDQHVIRGGRQRKTGLATASSGRPSKQCNLPGFPCVEQLIQKYTSIIEKQMEESQTKKEKIHLGKKNIARSSLPNLESGEIESDSLKRNDKLIKNVRKLSLCFDKEPVKKMGSAQSVPSITSPTYLALPTFRKNKRRNSHSPSNVSDEGCSVVPPVREGSTCSTGSPTSSEEDAVWSKTFREDRQHKRCISSDSAVGFMYGSEDEKSVACATSVVEDDPDGFRKNSIPLDPSFFDDDILLKSCMRLRSDRWFIEHYGSSVLEKLPDNRTSKDEWGYEGEFVDPDRRMSEVDSLNEIGGDHGRRESNLSCYTDDDEHPGYRYFRTPSVVVSDHSDDPAFASSSITLEEIERFREEYRQRQSFQGDSSSECSATSSWSNFNSSISALDADYILRTPERKASDCSTCSTLSGDEDINCEPLLQDVRTRNKVGQKKSFRCITVKSG